MATNRTIETGASVDTFIDAVDNETRRNDSRELLDLMRDMTGREPKMWGPSMIGFGSYHYRYESGREGDFFITGFSPRKTALTVYLMPGLDRYEAELARLGPHKTGKSCLYLKSLESIDRGVLREMIEDSIAYMREKYVCQ